jgi:hypothetical protein
MSNIHGNNMVAVSAAAVPWNEPIANKRGSVVSHRMRRVFAMARWIGGTAAPTSFMHSA